jgi:hypothetical protein
MKAIYVFLLLTVTLSGGVQAQTAPPEQRAVASVERIWDRAAHNAFTDLILHNGKFYCAFREGSGHIPGLNGTVRILASEDGQNWRSAAHLATPGVDLRDPKLSVMPDGRIMVVIGGSIYAGRQFLRRDPLVAFSDFSGDRFFAPQTIELPTGIGTETDWLWRLTWQAGIGYGVVYQPGESEHGLQLFRTRDGIHYEHITALNVGGKPNETTLCFLPDQTMLALVRREGADAPGYLGQSPPPYTDWSWQSIGARLGGPNLIRLPDGRLLCATRDYTGEEHKTILAFVTLDGGFEKAVTLPSGGDTSYPGLAVEDDILYVSYYSSHEGKSSIYLAKIWWGRL